MKNLKSILFLVLLCFINSKIQSQSSNIAQKQSRIKNGEDVLIENHPYQADLGGCGGTIIGDKWILTAEHCVDGMVGRTIGVGYTKRSDKRSTGQSSIVKRVVNFPCNSCDLSLLELETPLDLSGKYAKAIKYASADVFTEGYVKEGQDCYATGWGQLDPFEGGSPDNLQGALLKFGKVQLSDDRIKVLETEGRLVCRGDSGGPLVVYNDDKSERILVGAVSGGEGTPCSDYGFWGNVANAASWIEQETGIKPYQEQSNLSIDEFDDEEESFMIYPNPANEMVHVISKKEIDFIGIYDFMGKEVLNSTTPGNIAVSDLPVGVYLLKNGEDVLSKLLVINR